MVFAVVTWMRLRAYEAPAALATPRVPASVADAPATQSGDYDRIEEGPAAVRTVDAAGIEDRTNPARSSREARYRELLRSAPADTGAKRRSTSETAAGGSPSLFDRIVTPIANALGGNKKEPAPQPQRAAPSPRETVASRRPATSSADPAKGEAPRDPQEQDPDSDVTPPQLLSADFTPQQVQDGEHTLLAVTITDNLSGVRGVSGVVQSPSASLVAFACQREGDTNRFVARINVPKDAPEGVWQIKYLTLTDNASNSANLNQAQGALPPTASFRVVSPSSDADGPELQSVWLDRPAMRGGDRNTLFVTAEDDKSGVSRVSGVFVSPSKHARLGFGCRGSATGTWECPLAPPACIDCGAWQLEQIQIYDTANNMAVFRGDNQIVSAVNLDISGEICDSAPPTIASLTLGGNAVSNAEGGTIEVRATLMDDGCGAASLSGQAVPPNGIGGQRANFSLEPQGDGQSFVGRITISQHAAKGIWRIAWLQAIDKGLNVKAYSSNDPIVGSTTFRVE